MGLVAERAVLMDNGRKMYQYVTTNDGIIYSRKVASKHASKFKKIRKITEAFETIGGDRINRFACAC